MIDFSQIYSKDPFLTSDEEFNALVADYRARRAQFSFGNMRVGSTKPKSAATKASLDLAKDLKLDI